MALQCVDGTKIDDLRWPRGASMNDYYIYSSAGVRNLLAPAVLHGAIFLTFKIARPHRLARPANTGQGGENSKGDVLGPPKG